MTPPNIKIRKMATTDINELLHLMKAESWSSDKKEFQLLLKVNPEGCYSTTHNNKLIGAATTIKYQKSGWIGNLIIHKLYRKQGIGTKLLTKAINHLEHNETETIYLAAAPKAEKLYKKHGFKPICKILRWENTPNQQTDKNHDTTTNQDYQKATDIDTACWKDNRANLFNTYLPQRTLLTHNNGLLSFGQVEKHYTIGPWENTKTSTNTAEILLQKALTKIPNTSIMLDVPQPNTKAQQILSKNGFNQKNHTILMYKGILPDIQFNNIYSLATMGPMG